MQFYIKKTHKKHSIYLNVDQGGFTVLYLISYSSNMMVFKYTHTHMLYGDFTLT